MLLMQEKYDISSKKYKIRDKIKKFAITVWSGLFALQK